MKSDEELTGVHGWLAWMALVLTFFAPLNILGASGNNPTYAASPLTFGSSVVLALVSLTAGVLIVRKKAFGIRLARIFFYVTTGLTVLEIILGTILSSGSTYALAKPLWSVAGGVLWLAYTYTSRRVALTFPTLKSSAEILQKEPARVE